MKLTLRIMAIVVILFMALDIACYFHRRIYAESIASQMVQKYCQREGYDLAKLSGPTNTQGPPDPPSYSWIYKDSMHHLELVVAMNGSYEGEIAVWDFNRKD